MTRERVLYTNPLAIAAVRYQYRTRLGVFYFRLFLRVSALSRRVGPSADRSTLVFPVPRNDYTNEMNKCGGTPNPPRTVGNTKSCYGVQWVP
jgi:hypothetical protein